MAKKKKSTLETIGEDLAHSDDSLVLSDVVVDDEDKTPTRPGAKLKSKAKLVVTYDGSAMDTETTKAVPMLGDDGKPMKRRWLKPPVVKYVPMDVYKLWGIVFPSGEPVEVFGDEPCFHGGRLSLHDLAVKLRNLGCFDLERDGKPLEDEDELFVAPPKRARQRRAAKRAAAKALAEL